MSVHQKPDGRWYVSWREGGKQHTRTFGRGPEGEAAAREHNDGVEVTFKRLLELFLKIKELDGTSKNYRHEVRRVGEAVDGFIRKPLRLVTEWDILEALDRYDKAPVDVYFTKSGERKERKRRPMGPVTKNRYVSYLKVVFNFGVERGYLDRNPLARWKKRREQPRALRITESDLQRIYQVATPHLKWIIKVVVSLGVRPGRSEAFSLRWEDINWERREIIVRSTKTRDTSAYRVIPFSEEFAEDLKSAHQRATTPFLCEYKGQPIHKIRNAWKTALRKAGVPSSCVLYELRHLYATTLLSSGVDVKTTSELLGHKSPKMTLDVYQHVLSSHKREAVKNVPKIGGVTSG